MKDRKKEVALELRKDGYSVSEIAQKLSVAKSTASLWVRGVLISNKGRGRLKGIVKEARIAAGQTLSNKRKKREESSLVSAKKLFDGENISNQYSYILAALIYECEGAKTSRSTLEFTNSDPVLVAIFLKLMRAVWKLDEAKFRVVMHLHSYHDEEKEKDFWAGVTGIPEKQFTKTFQKSESGKVRKTEYRGCVQIKYFDVNIKRMLLAGKPLMAKKMGL
jgi:transposase-like protein